MLRKEEITSSEWVFDIGGHTLPLKAVLGLINGFMCVIIAYFMFNLGASVAIQTLDYVSTPKSACTPTGDCTYCIPYADGTKIKFNCTTKSLATGFKIGEDYVLPTNKTFTPLGINAPPT